MEIGATEEAEALAQTEKHPQPAFFYMFCNIEVDRQGYFREMDMRILTWNCCHGNYTERFARVEHFKPDVTILPEACQSQIGSHNIIWAKVYNLRGIAVGVNNGFSISRLHGNKLLHPCVHGYQISGPFSFNLLACWSHPRESRNQDYRSPWVKGIAAYEAHLKGRPLVIAGDFNDNPVWDEDYDESFEPLLDTICKKHNLVSAYHKFYREKYGEETRFTHLHNKGGKYHVDYVLLPRDWRLKQVMIGKSNNSRNFMDHMPLLVELESGN